MNKNLIVALDVDSLKKAKALVDALSPHVNLFKVGNQLFTRCGQEAIKMIQKKNAKVFLDLKFHDIPNTVANAIRAAKEMGVFMVNIHASGGKDMMQAAVAARGRSKKPILIAVTVLTSLGTKGLKAIGVKRSPAAQVKRLAFLARSSKADGVVCSPQEAAAIRKACGDKFLIVTPGIRPVYSKKGDQKRTATPAYAIEQGADYIVVGRPITEAKDPASAARTIFDKP